MTKYDVGYGVDNLKNFLINHGGLDYFDEITEEVNDSYSRNTYLTKSGTSIKITTKNTTNGNLAIDNYAFLDASEPAQRPSYIKYGYVTDNAIVLIPVNYGYTYTACWTTPIVISKTKNGRTGFFFGWCLEPTSGYATAPFTSQAAKMTAYKCYTIDDSGNKETVMRYMAQTNNDDNRISTAQIPCKTDILKDVFYVTDRAYYNVDTPFLLDIDGTTYATFAYNTVLIKSE